MVTVPYFCPDVPYLKKNPVFMYYPDRFLKPNPFKPDVAVSIDSVVEQKRDALMEIESQFYEGGANGSAELMPSDPAKQAARRKEVRQNIVSRNKALADRFRDLLGECYGKEAAAKVEYAEAFELCEYGRQPNKDELRQLFPFK
jgi:hypothetical protein